MSGEPISFDEEIDRAIDALELDDDSRTDPLDLPIIGFVQRRNALGRKCLFPIYDWSILPDRRH